MEASRLVVLLASFRQDTIPGGVDGISMPTPIISVSKSHFPIGSVETFIPKEVGTGPPFSESTWRS